MSKSKRLTFSREFKLEAVRQLDLAEKPAADLIRELGIPRNREPLFWVLLIGFAFR